MAASPQPPNPRRGTTNPRITIVEFTRSLVDRAIGRPDRVRIADIREEVERRFMGDQQFVYNLAMMNVSEITNAAIREAIAETRGPTKRVIVRDFITTPADMVAQTPHLMTALALRWGRFLEWDGTIHIRLTAMTRGDLLRAATIRRERANRELAYAEFFENLAAKLPDDTTTVGVAIPFEQIEQSFVAAQEKYGRLDPIPPGGVPTGMGSDLLDPTPDVSPDGDQGTDTQTGDSPEGGEATETDASEPSDETK
jgi:hypothetical protein